MHSPPAYAEGVCDGEQALPGLCCLHFLIVNAVTVFDLVLVYYMANGGVVGVCTEKPTGRSASPPQTSYLQTAH